MSLVRARQGTAAIEFAFILPLLLTLIAGISEFGSIFTVYNQTNRLATQYAIAWSDCSDDPPNPPTTCRAEMTTYATAAAMANIAPQLNNVTPVIQMFQVKMSGATPVVTYAYPNGSAPNSDQTAALNAVLSSGQLGVLVTVSYAHSLRFFRPLMTDYLNSKLSPSYTVVQLKSDPKPGP